MVEMEIVATVLHVGDFPRPTHVYPPGGKVGEKMQVTYIGDPSRRYENGNYGAE